MQYKNYKNVQLSQHKYVVKIINTAGMFSINWNTCQPINIFFSFSIIHPYWCPLCSMYLQLSLTHLSKGMSYYDVPYKKYANGINSDLQVRILESHRMIWQLNMQNHNQSRLPTITNKQA